MRRIGVVSIDAVLPDNFSGWLTAQRWYTNKTSTPNFDRIGGWRVDEGDVAFATHYLLDHVVTSDGAERAVLYQVPLSERTSPLEAVEPIGTIGEPGSSSERLVYDATSDPAYAAMLLRIMLTEQSGADYAGHRQPGAASVEVTSAKVLSGEQSNTSIICQVTHGNPVIVKVFRALHHGENPDVVLQSEIAAAGSDLVPASVGSITGSWPDTGRTDGLAVGHLAFAQEFLPGVEDAWRVALRAAEAGEDFTERAYALGVATAEVHAVLAAALPTHTPSEDDIAAILNSMEGRLTAAVSEVPSLEAWRAPVETIFRAARTAPWPALQRIHGDYHLGQVLAVPDRGWVLLDFEGEPMRLMAERSEPDVTLRDVAGMLRSFDYVAGSVLLREGTDSAAGWAAAAREAFVDGYVARSGVNLREHRALLDAFEVDKALYEAVYEARNRPGWLEIPTTAVRRLAESSAAELP
jgi:maltokinase